MAQEIELRVVYKKTKKPKLANTIMLARSTLLDDRLQSANGNPSHETFYVDDGDVQGPISTRMWHHAGVTHRTDGPAYETYDRNGVVTCRMYWWRGKNLQSMIDSKMIIINDDGSLPEDSIFTLEMMQC